MKLIVLHKTKAACLAVCAILEINPFDLVSFTADGWEIIPRDDDHTRG